MPTGIIINSLSVLAGGLLGAYLGNKLSDDIKINLNLIFGLCSMAMGINSIILVHNMPAVIMSLVIGTVLGTVLHLGDHINKLAKHVSKLIKNASLSDKEHLDLFVTAVVLFCASGTGIYGSLVLGMTGDSSILISKSILDFFTAMIFACSLGQIISLVSIPQFTIMIVLFIAAGWILPLTTPVMIQDFKACGGLLMLATGFRICKIKNFPIADMLPSMILVMPMSFIWITYITALIN